MKGIRANHGRLHAETLPPERVDPETESNGPVPDPHRDPVTKRFVRGNTAAHARKERRAQKEARAVEERVVRLWGQKSDRLAVPIRPHALRAGQMALAFIADLRVQSPLLNSLAEHAAICDGLARAHFELVARGALKLSSEARGWAKEFRLAAITLTTLSRSAAAGEDVERSPFAVPYLVADSGSSNEKDEP